MITCLFSVLLLLPTSLSVEENCLKFFNRDQIPNLNETSLVNFCDSLDASFYNRSAPVKDGKPLYKKPSNGEVWGYGLLMVTLISLTSVLGVSVLPLMSKSFYSRLLSCLIGLAVGSLAGSSAFHLIPAAFSLADSAMFPHHSYLSISLTIWGGLYAFFIIERFLKIFMDAKARRKGELCVPGHSHKAANGFTSLKADEKQHLETDSSVQSCLSSLETETVESPLVSRENREVDSSSYVDTKEIYENSQSAIKASFGHQHKPHPVTRPTVEGVKSLESGGTGHIATVAWMIIFGDGIHNFIDGLSIGAAFSQSILTGISVSVAVLCEEFPHELGDFAVLLNSGMSIKQAVTYNFLSACTCYLGLVLGILLGELDANCYIFGLAGGMFLYISLVDMVPELNESVEEASKTSVTKALKTFALQNLGILIGIGSLYTLARFQDDILIG